MKEQIEEIDNVLITACIALLAAFVVLYSVDTKQNLYFKHLGSYCGCLFGFDLIIYFICKVQRSTKKKYF